MYSLASFLSGMLQFYRGRLFVVI